MNHCNAHEGEKITISYQDEHVKSILAIMVCLQTIKFFIKKISAIYSLEFHIEKYDDEKGRKESLTANQPSSINRDAWLSSMAHSMVEDLVYDGIKGSVVPIESLPKHSLTHWRALSLECAGQKLTIYPDGGFMNGWNIYNEPGKRVFYDVSTITYDTEVSLFRNQDLKFDVTLEDC